MIYISKLLLCIFSHKLSKKNSYLNKNIAVIKLIIFKNSTQLFYTSNSVIPFKIPGYLVLCLLLILHNLSC
jgi:hypothetical protein